MIHHLTSEHKLEQGLFIDSNKTFPKTRIINYFSEPRIVNPEEDILKWWKTNQKRFILLSRIARDYFVKNRPRRF